MFAGAVLLKEKNRVKTAADIYRFNVDPDSDTAAANVLRFVGRDKKVLEIGAGPGSISRPLQEFNGCRVSAIEIDEKSVEILRGFCEEVWRRDLNDPAWADGIPDAPYDNVVIADVLEHIVDPWTMLRRAASFLKPGGSIVVSIPHASHAAILACLLNNDFDYRDWGLLDRTHIRFFSMKNLQALFEGAGLRIADFSFVLKHPAETEFADAWHALPPRTRAVLETGDYANVYQVVLRAVPEASAGTLPGRVLTARPAPALSKLKYIAFYLPQFHPIPENDEWWGKGFTEWTNVTKAQPLFTGHQQPHLPTELGFYDLRVREVQHQQIALAKAHGIDAFCFHYYWFGGKRLLERPVLDFLADPKADIEFCLCWANENWTRKWDASEHEVLMEQTYSPENDIAFIDSVIPFFRDPRHLRVNGAPALVVYRPQHMPDARATAERWRAHCREAGIGEIHLIAALTHGNDDFEQFGFDAGVEFPPHNVHTSPRRPPQNLVDKVDAQEPLTGIIWDYGEVARSFIVQDHTGRRVYRGVFPAWDNTARVGTRAVIIQGGTPGNYERWLDATSHRTVAERAPGERLVFINAWNEWAEGCHLEPCREFGRDFLEATRRVKTGHSTADVEWEAALPVAGQSARAALRAAAPPRPAAYAPDTPLTTRLAIKVSNALQRYPTLHDAARSAYRATVSRDGTR
jgi:2-polyprenyl-3-methyl-5-hydroxy-6-metoxy-1,4-benzoquinol methylase